MIKRFIAVTALLCASIGVQAERYITLSPHLTEILYDLGVGEQIVGTVDYSDYPEEAKQLPVIGNFQQLNIESIVALRPDIIFAWPDGNPDLQLQRLEELGLKVFKSGPNDLQQLANEITTIGTLVGKTARATEIHQTILDESARLATRYGSSKPMSVIYQIWHQPLRALGSDPWLIDILHHCGATNIFAHLPQAYPQVSIESVVSKQPDIIILPETSVEAARDELWQKWQSIEAVKQQHIITINADWLHRYTGRSIKGVIALCEAIDSIRNKQS